MGLVTLQAAMAFAYAGRSLAVGDTFTASQRDGDLLKITGRAVDAPSPRLRRKDLEPAPTSDDTPQRRQYRRRDLEAEP